jgi:ribose transport system ATP-binding protein
MNRLEVHDVSKTFGRTTVLRNASLTVGVGEIHALVGENGSGKSTLVKVISGHHAPDSGGMMALDGAEVRFPANTGELRELGLSVLHQDLGLVDTMTVLENLRITSYDRKPWTRRIDWAAERAQSRAILDELRCHVELSTLAGRLTPADRAKIAIGRALTYSKAGEGLLVFDESTRALPKDSLDQFYAEMKELVSAGTSVILVSHNLEEVLYLADKVTVLRDGTVVGSGLSTEGLTERKLVELMLGHELEHRESRTGRVGSDEKVEINNLAGRRVTSADLTVRHGQILGLTGLVGSGFEDVPYLLTGASPASGTVTIDGETVDLSTLTTDQFIDRGMFLVPENRAAEGLALDMTVAQNVTLPRLSRRGSRWFTGSDWRRSEVTRAIEMLGIVPPSPDIPVSRLSGGNQQKVLLAKWMLGGPRVLALHEPTQGVDVGARADLLAAVADLADVGCAVLLATVELELLEQVCDRVIVFRNGEVGTVIESSPTVHDIVEAIYGGSIPFGDREVLAK